MINLRSILSIGVALLACLPASQSAYAQDQPIRIAVEGNFPPFNYLDANGKLQGMNVEIADALCAAMQVECTLVVQEWDQMIPGLIDHEYDAIVSSMSMSTERRKQAAFTQRYYDSPSVFITKKDAELRTFEPQDLADRKVGVTLATSQMAYAQDLYADSDITIFDSSPDLYQGLANGEVEVILEDKLAAFDWLTNTRAGQCCEFRGEDVKESTYFGEGAGIAVNKEKGALLSALDAALVAITEDGTYSMINAKYFPFSIR